MTMTTTPSARDAFVKNDARLTENGHQLKLHSRHSDSAISGGDTTDMGNRKRPAGNPIHNMPGIAAVAIQTAFAHWTSIILMISLIFGGCCANVFALEAIVKDQPDSGPLITFAQFILTALFMLPSFFSPSAGFRSFFLSQRSIPLRSWFIYTAFFVTVNLLNNWAFAYRISVPLHIILRSGGPVASMAVGCLYAGRRYSRGQILSVALLTFGVVTSALADAQAKGEAVTIGGGGSSNMYSTFIGFAILALAMLLSAFQGIYADRLYETYGRSHWKEALFYSHTLSLPLFLPSFPRLLTQWRTLNSSPSLLYHIRTLLDSTGHTTELLASDETSGARNSCAISTSNPVEVLLELLASCHVYEGFQPVLGMIPVQIFYLLANALTQYWCIRGVHLLSAKSSSLTVTIVLNIRKLVSLLLSIYLFGNTLSKGVLMGAILVFVGGSLYGFEGARLRRAPQKID
ncbi:UAA transporter family-domain-containing protein [Aspergillus spinulosporus]